MTDRRSHTLSAHLALGAVTLVWGATFPLVKAALRDAPPLLFNFARMSIASVVLLAVNAGQLRNLKPRQLRLCAVAGIILALGYQLQTVGLARTTPSKSAFLTGLVVVLVPLLSVVPGIGPPGAPRPHALAVVGALLAFLGIVLLTGEPGAGVDLLSGMHRGEWLTLGCAVAFALHLLTLARAAEAVPARALGTLQIVVAAVCMLGALPFQPHQSVHWSATVLFALAVTAIFATAAAFTIQSWAQQHLPAAHTALILTMEPIFAWLASLLFLGERLGARALSGAGLILAGIVLAELGPTALAQAGILPIEP